MESFGAGAEEATVNGRNKVRFRRMRYSSSTEGITKEFTDRSQLTRSTSARASLPRGIPLRSAGTSFWCWNIVLIISAQSGKVLSYQITGLPEAAPGYSLITFDMLFRDYDRSHYYSAQKQFCKRVDHGKVENKMFIANRR